MFKEAGTLRCHGNRLQVLYPIPFRRVHQLPQQEAADILLARMLRDENVVQVYAVKFRQVKYLSMGVTFALKNLNVRTDVMAANPHTHRLVPFQHYRERLGRDIDFAEALHALFAFSLFGKHFLFTGDVAAVQTGRDIFAVRA